MAEDVADAEAIVVAFGDAVGWAHADMPNKMPASAQAKSLGR
jgi:hypothetical protein